MDDDDTQDELHEGRDSIAIYPPHPDGNHLFIIEANDKGLIQKELQKIFESFTILEKASESIIFGKKDVTPSKTIYDEIKDQGVSKQRLNYWGDKRRIGTEQELEKITKAFDHIHLLRCKGYLASMSKLGEDLYSFGKDHYLEIQSDRIWFHHNVLVPQLFTDLNNHIRKKIERPHTSGLGLSEDTSVH